MLQETFKKRDAGNPDAGPVLDEKPISAAIEKKPLMYLYFAYGSNMSKARMMSRVGNVELVSTDYTLPGYKLVFNAGAQAFGTFANLVKTGDYADFVEGVIYSLTKNQMRDLDGFEGAPITYNRVIERYKGRNMIVYISLNEGYRNHYRMSPMYAEHIRNGCLEHGFAHTLEALQMHLQEAPIYIPPVRIKRKKFKKRMK